MSTPPVPATGHGGAPLGASSARGARALFVGQGIKLLTQVIGLVVLSRILEPAEFGYMAVATVIVGFGEIIRDMGLSSAAIRSPELTNDKRDVLFWINTALGVFLMACVFILAVPLAHLFKTPQLEHVLPALSFVFLFSGVTAQYRANLNRTMRFAAMARIDAVAPAVGLAVAISAALIGASYWALVLQLLTTAIVTSILTIGVGRWMPRFPRRGTEAWPMVRFGGHVALSQLLAYGGSSVDTLALGLTSTSYSVGLYSRSFQLVMSPLNQLKSPSTTVAVPALSRLLDEPARFESYSLRGQAVIGYLVVPIGALLVGAPATVVHAALGPGWEDAAPIVALLAVAGTLQQLSSVANWIFVAKGRGGDLTKFSALSLVLKVVGVASFVSLGPVGVALGYTLAVCVAWPIAIVWATKTGGVRSTPLLMQAVRMLAVAAVAAATCFAGVQAAGSHNDVLSLVVAIVSVFGAYLASMIVPAVRRDLRIVLATLRLSITRA